MGKERWRSVLGWEGFYEVSNLGRVKSLYREQIRGDGKRHVTIEKLLKLKPNQYGYVRIALSVKGRKRFDAFVHKLVAEAFVKNRKNKPFVNHINHNRSDNRSVNLEWCTAKENQQHSIKHGRKYLTQGGRAWNAKLTEESVHEIRRLCASGSDVSQLAKSFKVNKRTIKDAVERKTWKHI